MAKYPFYRKLSNIVILKKLKQTNMMLISGVSLVHSPGPSVVLCALSIAIVLY